MTTSAVQPTVWVSDSFNFEVYGRQLATNRCELDGGSIWDVVMRTGPGFLLICLNSGVLWFAKMETGTIYRILFYFIIWKKQWMSFAVD